MYDFAYFEVLYTLRDLIEFTHGVVNDKESAPNIVQYQRCGVSFGGYSELALVSSRGHCHSVVRKRALRCWQIRNDCSLDEIAI